jgi:hypothetical protein
MSLRQAGELFFAFEKNGWTLADVSDLSKDDLLQRVLQVVRGEAIIKITQHRINLVADPFIPPKWSVGTHQKLEGKKNIYLKWDSSKVALYLDPLQESEKSFDGVALHKKLNRKPVLNANVLDYLLAHPELIPENWKGKHVFFWGTIYSYYGHALVRYLYWHGSAWKWGYRMLENDYGWHRNSLALMHAK